MAGVTRNIARTSGLGRAGSVIDFDRGIGRAGGLDRVENKTGKSFI